MHGDEDAVARTRELDERGDVALSSMTVYELYYGVGYTDKSANERRKVDSVISSRRVLPADSSVMKKAGRIDGELSREGAKVGQADVVIAATALLQNKKVLTRNQNEFERIPGLEVESY